MRVLMLGPTNSPHVEDLVLGLAGRGVDVVVGGEAAPNLPPSRLPDHGIRVEPAPPGAIAAPLRLIRRIRWVRRLMRELCPDVVHAHFLVDDPFYAVMGRARPLVATAWGLGRTRPRRAPGRFAAALLRAAQICSRPTRMHCSMRSKRLEPNARVWRSSTGVSTSTYFLPPGPRRGDGSTCLTSRSFSPRVR